MREGRERGEGRKRGVSVSVSCLTSHLASRRCAPRAEELLGEDISARADGVFQQL